jgi:hypothetical protein
LCFIQTLHILCPALQADYPFLAHREAIGSVGHKLQRQNHNRPTYLPTHAIVDAIVPCLDALIVVEKEVLHKAIATGCSSCPKMAKFCKVFKVL